MLRRLHASSVAGARCRPSALAFGLLLLAQPVRPAFAQDQAPPAPAAEPAPEPSGGVDDLEAMPDIGVDWPDLSKDEPAPPEEPAPEETPTPEETPAPGDPAADGNDPQADGEGGGDGAEEAAQSAESAAVLAAIDPSAPLRYVLVLEGMGDAADDKLRQRFDELSVLREGESQTANIAQIRRRGRTDATLLEELLRVRGYYDGRARLDFRPGAGEGQVRVRLIANPGTRYTLGDVDIDGLSNGDPREADLLKLFNVKAGDPADTDGIRAATDRLRVGLLDGGYPFGDVREPVLVINHEERSALLSLTVNTGGYRRIGKITVNPEAPFDADHVEVISRFGAGDPYRQSDIADLNRALVATTLVSQVSITPEEGGNSELVDLNIHLDRAPPRTISGELGYGTGEGWRAQASWQHRNFFPPEGGMTFRGVLGQQEQSLSAIFRRANFRERDHVLNGELSVANINQPAYQAQTVGVAASLERQTNLIFQKDWVWSLGTELRVSDERDFYGAELTPRRRRYVIAALPSSFTYDDSDDLLDPRRGFRLGARISPELSLQGGAFGYVRAQFDGSFYIYGGERLTFAGRGRLGTIVGAPADRIAPTRRFYAGGGASVRGYSYQAIGPRDLNNAPTGGRSLGEISIEARYRFGSLNQFGIVPFIDAGTISPDPWPTIRELRVGAGLGFRYYSNFGPIRIDVGTPINPQPGDSRLGVYVSLGQAF